ncbi:hypothetical protein SPOG_01027 [Schizosaccharomyces cryophilus OY26]|uniref:Uncharacterized protein n=1 Tax=Schizosaccharomyces cryophilus (strain OY26 / ATCC MYA-4695 / CBS 11777 / NBRC 106824 / NRRL Y48691) TaxID=653667 RepID=S9X8V0_SCHCR|nr:uncharacterized protein SPOG_01027 [Schizosaccharomyces cryophilus OY26]EPY50266.1 hypothetical protein SPOG_01027 [Schizosaccharomyces cryophilus OY26]
MEKEEEEKKKNKKQLKKEKTCVGFFVYLYTQKNPPRPVATNFDRSVSDAISREKKINAEIRTYEPLG